MFCVQAHLNPLPVSESLLCRYVAYLAEEGLAPKTIKLYLSAIRHLQVSMNLSDPKIGEMARLEQVVKGVKREYAKKNLDKRERLPITPELLMQMKQVWSREPKKFDNIMLWAACCVCYFGFLRSGEVTVPSEAAYDSSVHLNMSDIAVRQHLLPIYDQDQNKSLQNRPVQKRSGYLPRTHSQPVMPSGSVAGIHSNKGKRTRHAIQIQR